MMNPEPSPAAARVPDLPPKNCSNTSAGTCSTTSVCTVTTAGATRATAAVIAVRREPLTAAVVASIGDEVVEDCAADDALDAPWQAIAARQVRERAKRILMSSCVPSVSGTDRSGTDRRRGHSADARRDSEASVV